MSDDYVIAVRSYGRATVFSQKTYRMLEHNGLTSKLYIFVANEMEKQLYEDALKGCQYKKIVVGKLGGAAAIRAICEHFPKGQRIAFMDDDLTRFFEFDAKHQIKSDSAALDRYLRDGFATIDKYGLGAFTFSFMKNKMWIAGKPFKEFRPFMLAGNFFCCRNDPAMIITTHSHNDDVLRSTRFIARYGGILVYWWAGFDTNYGKEAGGMQSSGDRGTASRRLQHTKNVTTALYEKEPLLQLFATEPRLERHNPFHSMKLKTSPQIYKVLKENGKPIKHLVWPTWFGKGAPLT